MDDSTPLHQVPNLGTASARMLGTVGLRTLGDLRALGSVAAFARARAQGEPVSLNLLWALEGALSGMRWQDVATRHRTSLLLALEDHEASLGPQGQPRGGSRSPGR